jgi:hypothetical protein
MNETTTITPAKSALQYGILFGVIMVLEFVIAYVMDIDPISNPAFGTTINVCNYVIIPIALILIGCNGFKKANSGFISFSQCLKIGVTICVVAAAIYGVFNVIFNMIFPEFMEEMLRKTRTVMMEKNSGMNDEQMEVALEWTKKFMNPWVLLPFVIVMYAFIGLFYSLIIGAIVKKDQPQSL